MGSLYPRRCKNCQDWFFSKTEFFEHFQFPPCNFKRCKVDDFTDSQLENEPPGGYNSELENKQTGNCNYPISETDFVQVDTCVDQAVVEVYGQVVNSTPNSTYEMPNTSTNKPLPHWAKGLNVVMSNLLLKMKKRNFKENDVSMILQEFEKMKFENFDFHLLQVNPIGVFASRPEEAIVSTNSALAAVARTV